MTEHDQHLGPQPWPPQLAGTQRSSQPNPAQSIWQGPPPLRQRLLASGPAYGGALFVVAQEAEYSRRWRFSVGMASLVLAAASSFYGWQTAASVVTVMRSIEAAGGHVSQTGMAIASFVILLYGVAAVAYAVVGIWNIVDQRGTAPGPVIGAFVLALVTTVPIVLLLMAALLVHLSSTAVTPLYGAFAANVVMTWRSISVLRMKKESPTHVAR